MSVAGGKIIIYESYSNPPRSWSSLRRHCSRRRRHRLDRRGDFNRKAIPNAYLSIHDCFSSGWKIHSWTLSGTSDGERSLHDENVPDITALPGEMQFLIS